MDGSTTHLKPKAYWLLALLVALLAVLTTLPAVAGGGNEGTTILPFGPGQQLVCRSPEGVDIFPLNGQCPEGTVAVCVPI